MTTIGQDPVGVRIRDLRRQKGMSQAQLAHPELSDSYVSLIESGKRSPTRAVLELLAAKLECSPTYLVNGVTAEQLSEVEMQLSYARLALENGEAAEARRSFGELIANPHLVAMDQLRRDAEFGYALAFEAVGDLEGAIQRLGALLEAGDDSPDRRIAISLALCRCLREAGRFSESVRSGEDALRRELASGWSDPLVELGSTVLAAYIERGDRARSGQLARHLLAEADRLGTPRAIVAACWNAATVMIEAGETEEALALGERALAFQSETGGPKNLARLQLGYARMLMDARPEDAAKARDLLAKVRGQVTSTSASLITYGRCLIQMARCELLLGNVTKADELLAEVISSGAEESSRVLAVERRLVLAQARQALGESAEAITTLASAADLLEEMHATRRAAESWFEVAERLGDLGDLGQSKSAYDRALDCAGL